MWCVPGRADGAADPSLAEALGTLHARASVFDPARAVLMARAPGRLDLMGGIADYSGGLVLEFPTRQATCVFAQSCEARRLTIESLVSGGAASSSARAPKVVSISLDALTPAAGPLEYARARAWLGGDPEQAWAAYVAGALVVLQR
jgi:L-arabinokinase